MNKTISTITAAALLVGSALTAVPARANDDLIRLGLGIGGALLGEAMKGRQERPAARRYIDREPSQQRRQQRASAPAPKREKATRTAKTTVPAAVAATAVTVAEVPAATIVPTPRPDPATVQVADASNPEAAMLAAAGMSAPPVPATIAETPAPPIPSIPAAEVVEATDSFPIYDENGLYYVETDAGTADTIAKAIGIGMIPSVAIATVSRLRLEGSAEREATPAPVAPEPSLQPSHRRHPPRLRLSRRSRNPSSRRRRLLLPRSRP